MSSFIFGAARDEKIGKIPILSEEDLSTAYQGKHVLVVGGTRGVGLGIAMTVAKAGAANVVVVGRSEASAKKAVQDIPATNKDTRVDYVLGDIGTISKGKELVDSLQSYTDKNGKFDYLFVTAAVFPDWSGESFQNEDGIEKCFAIAVVGRYIIYDNVDKFLKSPKDGGRILNVLASGEAPPHSLDHDLITGVRNPKHLFDAMMCFASGNEMMLRVLRNKLKQQQEEKANPPKYIFGMYTRVSTHPGLLKTDLLHGQGWWFDLLASFVCFVAGISIEEAGIRQASILASAQLTEGEQNYVDDRLVGRIVFDEEQEAKHKDDIEWLSEFLQTKVQ